MNIVSIDTHTKKVKEVKSKEIKLWSTKHINFLGPSSKIKRNNYKNGVYRIKPTLKQ